MLDRLRQLERKTPGGWWRPMNFGGAKNTAHSKCARRMVKQGWVAQRERQGNALVRAHNEYQITMRGYQALLNYEALQHMTAKELADEMA